MLTFKEHIIERGWKPWIKSWVCEQTEIVTFPIYNISGKMIGYQRYNWRGSKKPNSNQLLIEAKYYTFISERSQPVYFYGLDNVLLKEGVLIITEGIWDAVRATNCWYDAIALTTNVPHKQTRWLIKNQFNNRILVGVADNDGAGEKLSKTVDLLIHPPAPYKDLGEMPEEEISHWLPLTIQKNLVY